MSVWPDVRLLPDFLCVTVPDQIDYPLATYTSFQALSRELGGIKRLGVAGMEDMSESLLNKIRAAFQCELVRVDDLLFKLRLTKSENEIACLREAARIADEGMKAIMQADIIGMTRDAGLRHRRGQGASGGRGACDFHRLWLRRAHQTDHRPAVCDQDHRGRGHDHAGAGGAVRGLCGHLRGALCGGQLLRADPPVIDTLIRASAAGLPYLRAGEPMKNFVRAVRDCFRKAGLAEYDVYPPLHGIGCAEAESPLSRRKHRGAV